ncbi:MAG TPA: hypothetical protein VK166_10475 [Chitinophagaceae bacterium]|nr:hypothetical protein [Chitinophagaceae bacterium]
MMVDDIILNEKVAELKKLLPKREWKYYHLSAIENFIFHLKSIENERTRDWMSKEINNYLELALTKVDIDARPLVKAMDLGPLIWKMSDTYKYQVGFVRNPDLLITTVLAVISFFVFKSILSSSSSLILCTVGYSAYLTYAYIKKKNKKVY